jgi:predicted transposase/invertase (TIGR01784 family)
MLASPSINNMTNPQTEYDSPWKEILQIYFPDFISFFFPDLYAKIDWTKPIEFLDKELRQVTKDAEIGKRLADALVKVYRTDGQESCLYIHIEVQSQSESDFAQRVYIYNYKIYDRFKCPIDSLVILADDTINWRPDHFTIQGERTTIRFDFPIVKLLDYRGKWTELEASRNPFATVVMVHLRTLETTRDRRRRKEDKLMLMKRLYQQGLGRQDIINLYGFIDWMMTLPRELQAEFDQEITQYEEEMKMPYITSTERLAEERGEQRGEQRGRQEGRQEGKQELITRQLNRRLGEIQPTLVEQIRQLPVEQLELLGEAIFDFSGVTDLEQWLNSRP